MKKKIILKTAVTYEVCQTVVDVKPPYRVTDEIYDTIIAELKSVKKYGEDITSITDVTPNGNFVYGGKEGAEYLRFDIDSRYITNEKAIQLLTEVFNNSK